ncbi:GRAS family protein RAD1-like [Andrographis paniculata]|uniref:GRAS family protein RAD1-like n=1 Tax=Andrographis paniculata TaxID=175694 RepID=UPI0021E98CE7|nr:GRAS family protein RAD1-like [Andrographis paniculata]
MVGEWLANHQGFAIRQFCAAARVELPEEEGWSDEMWPEVFDEMPQLSSDEVEEIFDEFFDVDCYEKDNADKWRGDEVREVEDASTMDVECHGDDDDNAINIAVTGVDRGLHLVHLLLACAEAVGCRDAWLAETILAQIWPRVSPSGDSLQRVAHCFASGLKSRLALLQNANRGDVDITAASLVSREEKFEAFALLHGTTPYIAFGHLAANDAVRRAATGKESIHIVDLGMEHTLQWSSLVRGLASKPGAHPREIRITGVVGERDPSELESSVRELLKEATSTGIYIEFNMIPEQVSPLSLSPEKLDLREGEALFVNSINHLHKHVKESRGSLKTILQSIKNLSPSLLVVVEQDANHNGPFFLGRFLESLHYYSAVFDSLDASLPQDSPERAKIEKLHFAEEIRNVVAYEGAERVERHERADQWRRQLGRAGFQAVGLTCAEEAREMVCEYGCDGYTVRSEKGCLQLGWKGRPIMLASAWQLNNVSMPS